MTEKGPAEGSVPPPYSTGPPPGGPGYPPYQQQPYPPQQPGPYPPSGPGPYPPGAYPPGPPPQGYYAGQPQPGQQQQSTVVVTVPTITINQSAFGDLPVQTTCPQCHQSVQTAIQYEIGLLAWLIFGILCLFGLWPCSCIPFCVSSCKDVVHSCPNCHAVIGRHKRIS